MPEYTSATVFEAEGARCGIVACRECGSSILVDPRDSGWSAIDQHNMWHDRQPADERVTVGELRKLRAWAKMISDLDRNEHGRHETDVDSGHPDGVSHGNPLMPTGTVIGHDMSGNMYVMPPRGERHKPEAWVVERKR